MSFLFDNPRAQKIIFEYKARPLMARVRYITKVRDFGNKTVLVETIIVYGGLMKMKRSLNINQFQ